MTKPPILFSRRPAAGGFGLRVGFILLLTVLSAIFVTTTSGCFDGSKSGQVKLYARAVSARDPRLLEIQAQFAGSLEGVRYKWFAVHGECNPGETTAPVTRFRFSNGAIDDEITVEVLRGSTRIGRSSIDVQVKASKEIAAPLNLKIEVTDIPLAERGGPETRANIAGRVIGDFPPESRVVVYARDDGVWFIQPTTNAKHPVSDDGTWSTWTHTGSAYAILVVPPDFVPLRTVDTVPLLRTDIFARVVVDGRIK